MADDKDDMPVDDVLTYLQSNAIMLHEMFLELQKAGFNIQQALYIIGQTAAAGIMEPDISVNFEDGFDDDDSFNDDTFD